MVHGHTGRNIREGAAAGVLNGIHAICDLGDDPELNGG